MIQLNVIIVREITQRHKYRWHITTEYYVILFSTKDVQIYSLCINSRCLLKIDYSIFIVFLINNIMIMLYVRRLRYFMITMHHVYYADLLVLCRHCTMYHIDDQHNSFTYTITRMISTLINNVKFYKK